MPTLHKLYNSDRPGHLSSRRCAQYFFPMEDFIGGKMGANQLAMGLYNDMFPIVGAGEGAYAATAWTVTTNGTSAAVASAATPGGGVLMTAGSTSTYNTNLQSVNYVVPTTARYYGAAFRVQGSSITTSQWSLGLGNSQPLPFTTDYTDTVCIQKAALTGVITGRVRGASGTAAVTGTLDTIANATEFMCGFSFYLAATTATPGPQGFFWMNDLTTGFAVTAFTSAQLTQLGAILTNYPNMYLNLNITGSAANPTMTVATAIAYGENGYN